MVKCRHINFPAVFIGQQIYRCKDFDAPMVGLLAYRKLLHLVARLVFWTFSAEDNAVYNL